MNVERKTVLITGASSGIGCHLARVFAENGYDLVLVARSEERLSALAEELSGKHPVEAHVLPADLSDPEAADEIFTWFEKRTLPLHTLVNNAGFTTFGEFAVADIERTLDMIRVNVTAVVQLTRLFLSRMLTHGEGAVLNVSSTAAFLPGPYMAVYYASKSFVLAFSESLAAECAGTGVRVAALCPGATDTGFRDRGHVEDSRLAGLVSQGDARKVAEAGFKGLQKGRRVIIPGFGNKLIPLLARIMPLRLMSGTMRKVQEPVS
jgi:short-subunit dehydrogenase